MSSISRDPLYLAGYNAGIELAAALIEGRASMAQELSPRSNAAAVLRAAREKILGLKLPLADAVTSAGDDA